MIATIQPGREETVSTEVDGPIPSTFSTTRAIVKMRTPASYIEHKNQFVFCGGDPVNFVDPFGLSGTLVIYVRDGKDSVIADDRGHAFISFQPDDTGKLTTYGTWGNRNPKGLHENAEVSDGRITYQGSRTALLDDAREALLMAKIQDYRDAGTSAFSHTKNCAFFAADAWEAATGEKLRVLKRGGKYPYPGILLDSIEAMNRVKGSTLDLRGDTTTDGDMPTGSETSDK